MKFVTRQINAEEERVWLNASGHWTRNFSEAHGFEDAEAEKHVKRLGPKTEAVGKEEAAPKESP